jgi:hypothetical protein
MAPSTEYFELAHITPVTGTTHVAIGPGYRLLPAQAPIVPAGNTY